MKCYSCNKEINEQNSINGVCKECHQEVLKRIENKYIEEKITKENEIEQKINKAVQEATKQQQQQFFNQLNQTRTSDNNISTGKLIGIMFIIFIGLMIYFFLSCLPSSQPKESKDTYMQKCEQVTFEELARNPEMHKGKDYVVKGKVIQVQESYSDNITLLVYITETEIEYIEDSYFEDAIYVTYEYESNSEDRILEGDIITIYGKCQGSKTYTTIFGASNTIPYINSLYIDIHK